jgi:hypothetical protein
MLMAAAVVNRLWAPTVLALKQAGLEYLLFDEAQAQAIRGSGREAAVKPESPDSGRVVSRQPPSAQAARAPAGDMQLARDSQVLYQGAPPRPAAKTPHAPPNPPNPPNPADWPADWQERLKKTRPAPVVWTYWELGRDVSGVPDAKRRDLLQDLLKDLSHPPGTHSFWPLALPGPDGEQELSANTPVFWEGVRLLQSRAVVVMGSKALYALALPAGMRELRPFRQVRHQGRQLIVLHSPDMLIQEPQRLQALGEFLRQALAPFTPRM